MVWDGSIPDSPGFPHGRSREFIGRESTSAGGRTYLTGFHRSRGAAEIGGKFLEFVLLEAVVGELPTRKLFGWPTLNQDVHQAVAPLLPAARSHDREQRELLAQEPIRDAPRGSHRRLCQGMRCRSLHQRARHRVKVQGNAVSLLGQAAGETWYVRQILHGCGRDFRSRVHARVAPPLRP